MKFLYFSVSVQKTEEQVGAVAGDHRRVGRLTAAVGVSVGAVSDSSGVRAECLDGV